MALKDGEVEVANGFLHCMSSCTHGLLLSIPVDKIVALHALPNSWETTVKVMGGEGFLIFAQLPYVEAMLTKARDGA